MKGEQELNDSFDRLTQTALRIKDERELLLVACKLAWNALDGEHMQEIPFIMYALRTAIDKAESQ